MSGLGPFKTAVLETAPERSLAKVTFGVPENPPYCQPALPQEQASEPLAPTHIMGNFFAQVGLHQKYSGDLLTWPVKDSGNQWVLTVF